MSNAFLLNLGDKVRDCVSGLEGIVVSRSEHLYGCNRYWVSPQEVKDGKPVEGCWLDEDACEVVTEGVIKRKTYRVVDAPAERPARMAGGPTDQPASHMSSQRGR